MTQSTPTLKARTSLLAQLQNWQEAVDALPAALRPRRIDFPALDYLTSIDDPRQEYLLVPNIRLISVADAYKNKIDSPRCALILWLADLIACRTGISREEFLKPTILEALLNRRVQRMSEVDRLSPWFANSYGYMHSGSFSVVRIWSRYFVGRDAVKTLENCVLIAQRAIGPSKLEQLRMPIGLTEQLSLMVGDPAECVSGTDSNQVLECPADVVWYEHSKLGRQSYVSAVMGTQPPTVVAIPHDRQGRRNVVMHAMQIPPWNSVVGFVD